MTIVRNALYGLMVFLAIGISGYAISMALLPDLRVPFVVEMFSDHPVATYSHLLGGGIALLVGAFQFSRRLRNRFTAWHRAMGRVYVAAVGVGGIAAFLVSLTTPGGLPAQMGFGMLAVLWLLATAAALFHILRRDIPRHQMWMTRSYALTLAAVTLRIYFPILLGNGVPFDMAYPTIAWLCWVPNIVVAEWVILSGRTRQPRSPNPL